MFNYKINKKLIIFLIIFYRNEVVSSTLTSKPVTTREIVAKNTTTIAATGSLTSSSSTSTSKLTSIAVVAPGEAQAQVQLSAQAQVQTGSSSPSSSTSTSSLATRRRWNNANTISMTVILGEDGLPINQYIIDQGQNLTIPCAANHNNKLINNLNNKTANSYMWIREGKKENLLDRIDKNGSLILINITTNDAGYYTCLIIEQNDVDLTTIDTTKIINLNILNESTTVETTSTGVDVYKQRGETLFTDKMPSIKTEINNQTQLKSDDNDDGDIRKINVNENMNVERILLNKNETNDYLINSTSDKSLLLNINSDNNNNNNKTLINLNSNNSNINRNNNNNYNKINRFNIKVRTTPGRVSYLTVRASTIIAVLIWEVFTNRTGGYALKSFTAEYRLYTINNYLYENDNNNNNNNYDYLINYTTKWERLDPSNISPNARQLEIYHLEPNTTYEFRIWANNQLGAGEIATTIVTTTSQYEEKDLIRMIMADAKNFDTRIWIAAVGVVMGTLVILSTGTCILLYKECHDPPVAEEELDSLELVPNIILNPGFCDSDDQPSSPMIPRQLPYLCNHHVPNQSFLRARPDDYDDEFYNDDNESLTFTRKFSLFFTGDSIKRL